MRALSIRQPWAWMILNAGKDVENRSWRLHHPNARVALHLCINGGIGAEILLHASSGMTKDEYLDCAETALAIRKTGYHRNPPQELFLPPFKGLDRGGIVGSFKISRLVTECDSPWFFGPLGLVLCDVKPLPFRPLKGQLGFFEVADV